MEQAAEGVVVSISASATPEQIVDATATQVCVPKITFVRRLGVQTLSQTRPPAFAVHTGSPDGI